MNLVLAVPTIRRYDLLGRLLNSAERGKFKPSRYCIIDNGGKLDAKVSLGVLSLPENTDVVRPGKNLGVAVSWNLALRSYENVIISNDDIELHEDTIKSFADALEMWPDDLMFHVEGWSLFMQRRALAEKIGYYDENFWPAYFEDSDYLRRMKLAGVGVRQTGGTCRHDRSASFAVLPPYQQAEHHEAFDECKVYYIAKWGGMPHSETLTTPAREARWAQ
jgi:GT2 family glycosyltransferase